MKRIVITMDGGIIQNIVSDEEIDVTIIDYDTEGSDTDVLTEIHGNEAYVTGKEVKVSPKEIDEILEIIEDNSNASEETGRIYCEELELACKTLEEEGVDFDLDSGNRIMTAQMELAANVLDEHGIDYDVI